MKTSKRITAMVSALALTGLVAGCDNDNYERTEYSPTSADSERVETTDANPAYDNTQAGTATDAEQLDVTSPVNPVRALALDKTVAFAEGSIELTEQAEQALMEVAESVDKSRNSYLTIRIKDGDSIDATAPSASIAALARPRAETVREFLEENNVKVVDMAVDGAGEVAEVGEGRPMSRPEPENASKDTQYIVITIEVDDSIKNDQLGTNM